MKSRGKEVEMSRRLKQMCPSFLVDADKLIQNKALITSSRQALRNLHNINCHRLSLTEWYLNLHSKV